MAISADLIFFGIKKMYSLQINNTRSMKNMSHYTYIYIRRRIDFHFVFKIILWNTIVKWIKVILKFQNYTLFRRGFPPENYEKYTSK